jgi:hypothetical protein
VVYFWRERGCAKFVVLTAVLMNNVYQKFMLSGFISPGEKENIDTVMSSFGLAIAFC